MSYFKEIIDNFIVFLYSEKGLAKATVKAYESDLIHFYQFLGSENEIIEDALISYLTFLKEKGYASSTVARFTFALKVFFRFLVREKKINPKLLLLLESPKVWQLIPEVLSPEEIETMLNLPNLNDNEGIRDRAILEVLYGCGLRVSELCSLNFIDINETYVKVLGKGSRERIVPIGKKAIVALDLYMLNVRHLYNSEENKALFLNKKGKRIDRFIIWKMIKNYAEMGNIRKHISPHTFRHTFATHLLDGGADIRVIQELLGHATIFSTERYTHVSAAQMKEAFLKYHPKY